MPQSNCFRKPEVQSSHCLYDVWHGGVLKVWPGEVRFTRCAPQSGGWRSAPSAAARALKREGLVPARALPPAEAESSAGTRARMAPRGGCKAVASCGAVAAAPAARQAALCPFHADFWHACEQYWARLQPVHTCTFSSASLTPSKLLHLEARGP